MFEICVDDVPALKIGDRIRREMRIPRGMVATVTITNDNVLQLAREMVKEKKWKKVENGIAANQA